MRVRLERIRNIQKSVRAEARLQQVTVRTLKRMRGKQSPDTQWTEFVRTEKIGNSGAAGPDLTGTVECIASECVPKRVVLRPAVVAYKPKCSSIACCKFGCVGDHGYVDALAPSRVQSWKHGLCRPRFNAVLPCQRRLSGPPGLGQRSPHVPRSTVRSAW